MIEWSVGPDIFSIGPITLRYYSMAFVVSFMLGYIIMRRIMTEEGQPLSYVDDLFMYVFIGVIVGARLGHCLFYEADYYLSNPIEIFKVWRGGLASHGAAVGVLVALYILSRKKELPYFWVLDRVVITIALAACFIRIGNLFNSEIYGIETDVPWAFIFTQVDMLPRHPTQIYEALIYLVLFFVLYKLYWQKREQTPNGLLFGLFLVGLFGFRFFVEMFKENQALWEGALPINMGQILSIPFTLVGIYFMTRSGKVAVEVPKKPKAKSARKAKRKK